MSDARGGPLLSEPAPFDAAQAEASVRERGGALATSRLVE
jgi:hypothetical protein